MANGKKKRQKEKELLEQKRIKFQIYESVTAIIATQVYVKFFVDFPVKLLVNLLPNTRHRN